MTEPFELTKRSIEDQFTQLQDQLIVMATRAQLAESAVARVRGVIATYREIGLAAVQLAVIEQALDD